MTGTPEIVLAAGGTGGHVFPAQALAGELLARGRRLTLITDRRGEAYRGALGGVPSHRIFAAAVSGRSLGGKVLGLAAAAAGFWQARRLLARLEPLVVVGFGGYPSLPTLFAATRAGIATLIHEQNAILGRVNRFLAPRVALIATSFQDTARLDADTGNRVAVTGNPVRPEISAVRDVPYGAPQDSGPINLLVTGGSQGAAILSRVVPAALEALPEAVRRRLRVVQQCRAEDLKRVRFLYASAGVEADLESFFDDLPARLARAHLVIARAGASTVSELAVAGRPAILVPYRLATDHHQSLNARALTDAGGAWTMEEEEFTGKALAARLDGLVREPLRLATAAARAREQGRPDGAARLADLVERLAPGNGDHRETGDVALETREAAA